MNRESPFSARPLSRAASRSGASVRSSLRSGGLGLALCLAGCGLSVTAQAQGFQFSGSNQPQPIQIDAEQGIEWRQETNQFIARGHAHATRGNSTIEGDTLIAYYREQNGKNDIYRLDAEGHVVVTSISDHPPTPKDDKKDGKGKKKSTTPDLPPGTPYTERITGETGTYDVDNAVMIVRGVPTVLTTPTDILTAQTSIEYWENRHQAVARGGAVAVRDTRRIQGDTLTAEFKPDQHNELHLSTSQAFGHVILTNATAHEIVTGDQGNYDLDTGLATVTSNVKVTRDENQLDGAYAEVNTNNGISRVFSAIPGHPIPNEADLVNGSGQRVHGLLNPKSKQNATGNKADGDKKDGGKKEQNGATAKAPRDESKQPAASEALGSLPSSSAPPSKPDVSPAPAAGGFLDIPPPPAQETPSP